MNLCMFLKQTDGGPRQLTFVNGVLQMLSEPTMAPGPTSNKHPECSQNISTNSCSASVEFHLRLSPPCVEGAAGRRSNKCPTSIGLHNQNSMSTGKHLPNYDIGAQLLSA